MLRRAPRSCTRTEVLRFSYEYEYCAGTLQAQTSFFWHSAPKENDKKMTISL